MIEEQVHYFRISEDEPLPSITAHAPFRTVVVLNGIYSHEWQDTVSRWLVDSGCRYMMAWGPNCCSWDDSVDYAQIQKFPDETPDEEFVMTTWHQNETLESVFWYCQFCASLSYNDVELREAIILDVSQRDRKDSLLALYKQAETLPDREDELDS